MTEQFFEDKLFFVLRILDELLELHFAREYVKQQLYRISLDLQGQKSDFCWLLDRQIEIFYAVKLRSRRFILLTKEMKTDFQKVKTEHHILSEFHAFLKKLEQLESIQRIIPGRIHRQQKASSDLRFTISYPTQTGLKAKMSKGSTSQELFIILLPDKLDEASEQILELRDHFTSSS